MSEVIYALAVVPNQALSEEDVHNLSKTIANTITNLKCHISCATKLNRIFATFESSDDYAAAKQLISTVQNVESGEIKQSQHLGLPQGQRTMLISPPPSPPEGWQQVQEKAPISAEQDFEVEELSSILMGRLSQPGEEYELVKGEEGVPSVKLVLDDEESAQLSEISLSTVPKANYNECIPK